MGIFTRKDKKGGSDADKGPHSSDSGSIKSPSTQKPLNGSPSANASLPHVALPRAPDPALNPAAYLRSIYAVRERCKYVTEKAKRNQSTHFDVDMTKFGETARYVVSIINRDYAPDYASIPSHGRWQHFEVGGRPRVDQLMATWPSTVNAHERTRRLIDLFLVSGLLDAGAGTRWAYKSKESGRVYRRSEGLAVASLEMFKAGAFSSNPAEPCQVDGAALRKMNVQSLAKGLQVSESNSIDGLEGRANLLVKLGDALQNQDLFGLEARPGYLLDYLLSHPSTQASSVPVVPVPTLWDALMDGLFMIWPERTLVDGISLGDAWPCSAMPTASNGPWENIVPFHKPTQWLCYSLMVPMTKLMHVHFAGTELLTGLPEYRNGGLLIDTGLLTLKPEDARRGLEQYQINAMKQGQPNVEVVPMFAVDDDAVVEWRALTVGFLDELLVEVNSQLGLAGSRKLSLTQLLEGGTWKGGREIAEVSRPNTKEAPIMIVSDGTVF